MTSPPSSVDPLGTTGSGTTDQTTPQYVPPLNFTAPDGFHALPITESEEERANGIAEFVRELFPNGDESLWQASAPQFTELASVMAISGHAYSAIGLFAIDEGIAHVTLNVAAEFSEHTDPEIAAQGIRAILASDPGNQVGWIDLPCGPAISCVTLHEFVVGQQLYAAPGGGEDLKHIPTGQIQVHVPFPTGPFTVIFTLQTTAMDHWGDVCDMMAAILRTVSFPQPGDEVA